jgi:transposase-like protein
MQIIVRKGAATMNRSQTKPLEESLNVNILDAGSLEHHACQGLLSLSVELGLMVFRQMMEEEATEIAGPKGKHNPDRTAYRHGQEKTQIVLGGTKIKTDKIRVRGLDGNEKQFNTLASFQNEDPLNDALMAKLLSGVSTRKYEHSLEYNNNNANKTCTSKSDVSRRFTKGMKVLMDEFFTRPLNGNYPIMIIDGICISELTVVVAMGIDADGHKKILGMREGGTENNIVVKELFTDLVARGVNASEPRLYVLDGAKSLDKAVTDTFGTKVPIQRCQVHKKRNVLSHLPESEQVNISIDMTNAYKEFDYEKAQPALLRIHSNLEHRYPKAAESLKEGLEDTLTAHRLGIPGLLRQTLSSTNVLESANSICKNIIRKVSRYRNGTDVIRHAATGFMEAEKGFKRVKGYKEIPLLQSALANDMCVRIIDRKLPLVKSEDSVFNSPEDN